MNKHKKIGLSILIVIGVILPFIPSLTIIEMFFMLIPFAILFAATLAWLIVSLFSKNLNRRNALFAFSILPIFLASQLLSGFAVAEIQKLRSNRIIAEIEKLKTETGSLPDTYSTTAGIEYILMKNKQHFVIKYSRGFMVTEKYRSENKEWRSHGWND